MLRRASRTTAFAAVAGILALGGAACSEEDEDDVQDRIDQGEDEVEQQVDEGTEEGGEGSG
ncbi:MAG: hypothetical protein H0U89_03225 [Acidimicrobiia bacterium]|nr:hypothetical protein [Acidimicrobiia bacterium]